MSPTLSIGRFAPSPSGPLHFGSLLAAVASFMQVKHQGGKWLVRIEDIDPPREVAGASDTILQQLEQHGLYWDDNVIYQSNQLARYIEILTDLKTQQLTYHCECARHRLNLLNGIYDAKCHKLYLTEKNTSVRISISDTLKALGQEHDRINFCDTVMGDYTQSLIQDAGDFVLRRRDGLISYQLAVVIDDHLQGITEIIRGADLIDSTPRQILLQQCLGYKTPTYGHIPVAKNNLGQKLSKQHHAKQLPQTNEHKQLWLALDWLQQSPPQELRDSCVDDIISWGIKHWDINKIPKISNGIAAPENF
ncbi:MAG: tRNA glutamyl-Q(34) synthetase GluQRS [Porticoccaceae bacterium]